MPLAEVAAALATKDPQFLSLPLLSTARTASLQSLLVSHSALRATYSDGSFINPIPSDLLFARCAPKQSLLLTRNNPTVEIRGSHGIF